MATELKAEQIIYIDVNADFVYPENNIVPSLKGEYELQDKKEFKHNLNVYTFNKVK